MTRRDRGIVYQMERIPPEVWQDIKAEAARKRRSLRDVCLDRLRRHVDVSPTSPPSSLIPVDPELGF